MEDKVTEHLAKQDQLPTRVRILTELSVSPCKMTGLTKA